MPVKTALVIEDDPTIRQFIVVNLTARDFEVMEAADGEEGLNRLRENAPSVVLLDLRMPGMSGSELLEIMLDDPELRSIPVVVVTASVIDTNRIAVRDMPNVTHILLKPFKIEDVMQAVNEALSAAI
ncbi:MAG TPA: response regulator [Aggregatilineales bacterium]|jgi:CheY-like chemotaxis protein|nr:response regulator [Aggregatilineales bacterium]